MTALKTNGTYDIKYDDDTGGSYAWIHKSLVRVAENTLAVGHDLANRTDLVGLDERQLYNKYRIGNLQRLCGERGLGQSGNKRDLALRIFEFEKTHHEK